MIFSSIGPACVRYQRDAPVVAAPCPILLFVEYHDDAIFSLLRHLAPPPNTSNDIEQSPAQGGITVEGNIEQLTGTASGPTVFLFANERMASISSCIVA